MAERANETQQSQQSQPQGNAGENQLARSSQSGGVSRFGTEQNFLGPREFFRLSPFSLMRRMMEEMDRMTGGASLGRGQRGGNIWSPAIEVAERDGNYIVHAELPGLRPEDVNVEVTNDSIVVSGERKSEHEENKGGMHRSERSYGEFYRSIPLPDGINADQVKAKFENGILEVTVPLPPQQESNRRRIPIQAGNQSQTGSNQSGSGSTQTQSAGTQTGASDGGGKQDTSGSKTDVTH